MPLNIKNANAHRLAKELAELTGKSITEAVTDALSYALDNAKSRKHLSTERIVSELDEIALQCSRLAVLDGRPADSILGYNDSGVPE